MNDRIPRIPHLDLDEEGFLRDPADWNEEVARQMAAAHGLTTLTPAHWDIIRYIRDHYLRFGSLPVMSHVCRVNHLDKLAWLDLFEHGPKEAWKIAGLPDPGEEAKTYMENEVAPEAARHSSRAA
jgi:TusE/DsrC/DsvC family sulfur relay protein